MLPITKAEFYDILFNSQYSVEEKTTTIGRSIHKTTLVVNGVKTAMRIITTGHVRYVGQLL